MSVAAGFETSTAESRLWWQFETSDIEAVHDRARAAGIRVEQAPEMQDWGRRTLKLRSPNGYLVTFEEAGRAGSAP